MVRKGLLFLASVLSTATCAYLLFVVGIDEPADEVRIWAGLFFFGGTIPVSACRLFLESGDGEDESPILDGIAIAESPWGRVVALLVGLGFLAACAVAAFHPASQDVFMGWAGLALIGGFVLWGVAARMSRTGPHVTLSDEGIEDRTNGMGRIPWSAIASFERKTIYGHAYLVLRLHDPAALLAKRSAWTQWTHSLAEQQLGVDGVPIRISGLPVPAEDVVAEVARSIEEARRWEIAP